MIPEIAPYNNYTGDGSTTQFDFDFYIEDASQLVVQKMSSDGEIVTLTKDTDYTIHEVGNSEGSYITFPIVGSSHSKLASNEVISLMLTLPISQESEYGTSSELDLKSLEYSLDYLTRICQIMNRQVIRAIKIAEGSNINTDELALDLTTVADISNDITTVAGIASNVTAVKNNATNITTVAGDISNINAVANDLTNIDAVKADLTNIDAVKADLTNIDIVAGIASDVTTVAGIASDVTAVKNNADDISAVADDLTNIDTVAGDISNINAVANDLTNIDAVNSNKTNIDTVAGIASNVTTVASNISDIQSAGTNAGLAKQYAVGLPSEPAEGSAKYWAEQASTGQLQADWSQSDNTKKDYIKNKPTIPSVPTNLSSFTDDLGSSPTHTHSQYEVISKAVNTLDTSGTVTLTDNSVNTITPSAAVTFSLPTVSDNTVFHQILVQINLSTVYTLTLGTSYYFNKTAPDMSSTGVYNLIYEYDKANQYWVVGLIGKGTA